MNLIKLAERVEAATGPDKKLDLEIFRTAYDRAYRYEYLDDPGPEFTASIDAAMTLVPEGWRVDFIQDMLDEDYWEAGLYRHGDGGNINRVATSAATLSLVLTAVALRAKAGEG